MQSFFKRKDKNLYNQYVNNTAKGNTSNVLETKSFSNSVCYNLSSASWSDRNYTNFASIGYIKNVISHRCVAMIASSASFIPLNLYKNDVNGVRVSVASHPILDLLKKPNITQTYTSFMESIYSYILLSGNVYILAEKNSQGEVFGLKLLRPDRVQILCDSNGVPSYRCTDINGITEEYHTNQFTGKSDILHIKLFHPLNEHYGLSPVDSARYAIDQHNESSSYNKALLQNSARPSGALIVKNETGSLTDEQYDRLKEQVESQFSGANTGRPMLLEGGIDWKEMSVSPKDMDFIENRNSAAREIALAFGIPPQLLGIPGDATYSNMMEARLALWEQAIIPLINLVVTSLEEWLKLHFTNEDFDLDFNRDEISTLSSRRDSEWDKISRATFLTINEKRKMVGLPAIPTGNVVDNNKATPATN